MTNDRYWKSFWILFVSTTVVCFLASALLFFAYIGRIDAAAVGVDYTPDKDPFDGKLKPGAVPPLVTGGYIYQDNLPLGVTAWAWSSATNIHSGEKVLNGTSAIKATFSDMWGGFGVGGFKVSTQANKTLQLSVYPDSNVGDLYIEVYDAKGTPQPMQSLGWYAPSGALVANQWQTLSIPMQNLAASTSDVTAISINTTNPGTAFVDDINFLPSPTYHGLWVYVAPAGFVEAPFNPFATATQATLPFQLAFTPYPIKNSPYPDDRWYSPRGFFSQDYDAFRIGPAMGQNDAIAYLRSGKNWSDYEVTADVQWGTALVFSLIVRMQDEGNYASCSFSKQGDTIQMYHVQNGTSHLVKESDKLHYSDYTGGIGSLAATVRGNTVVCSESGRRVLSWDIKDLPPQGTVGMESWDEDDSVSPNQVRTFKVQPFVGE